MKQELRASNPPWQIKDQQLHLQLAPPTLPLCSPFQNGDILRKFSIIGGSFSKTKSISASVL
jgi:hypothetical protein